MVIQDGVNMHSYSCYDEKGNEILRISAKSDEDALKIIQGQGDRPKPNNADNVAYFRNKNTGVKTQIKK